MSIPKSLQLLFTKYFVVIIFLFVLLTFTGYLFLHIFNIIDLDSFSKYIDISFKTIAIIGGSLWTVNRYLISRTDKTKININADISFIPPGKTGDKKLGLLIFWLDIMNSGTSLLSNCKYFLKIERLSPHLDRVNYHVLYRWPVEGYCDEISIEPNSWHAINDALSYPGFLQAIRVYLEIQLPDNKIWDWHKTYNLSSDIQN